MKLGRFAIASTLCLTVGLARAQQDASHDQSSLGGTELTTKDGKDYKNIDITSFDDNGAQFSYGTTNSATCAYQNLPDILQKLFAPSPDAPKWVQAKTDAEAALQSAIKPMVQADQDKFASGAKSAITGQVFIATNGGNSVKLGAVHVSLYGEDTVKKLLDGRGAYLDQYQAHYKPTIDAVIAKMTELEKMLPSNYSDDTAPSPDMGIPLLPKLDESAPSSDPPKPDAASDANRKTRRQLDAYVAYLSHL